MSFFFFSFETMALVVWADLKCTWDDLELLSLLPLPSEWWDYWYVPLPLVYAVLGPNPPRASLMLGKHSAV